MLLGAVLNGCSSAVSDASKGGERSYTVGGTVTGLTGSVILQNNGRDNKTISADGSFTFAEALADQVSYAITVLTQPTEPSQTCTVSKGSGTIHSNVSDVQVSCTTNVYTISGSVSGFSGSHLVLQNNDSETIVIKKNGGFSFTVPVAVNSGYKVSVLTQLKVPTQICTVTNESGLASAEVTDIQVNCGIYPRFAYVTNYHDNTVSMYTVNADTGQLRHNGYVVTGVGPYSISVTPSVKFAYVVNMVSSDISAYTINAKTGVLTPIDADTNAPGIQNFPSGLHSFLQPDIVSIPVDPTGKFVYVAGHSAVSGNTDSVTSFTINPDTGALVKIASNIVAGLSSASVAVHPSGKFAYIANSSESSGASVGGFNTILAYTINAKTGALTSIDADPTTPGIQDFPAGTMPDSVIVDPSGKFVYAANMDSNDISAYTINSDTGALIPIDANPNIAGIQNFPSGMMPDAVTVDPYGKFVYAANMDSNDISAYAINSDTGVLTPIDADLSAPGGVQNFAAGTSPYAVSVDASGKFVYVVNHNMNVGDIGGISTYTINSETGALTLPGALTPIDADPNMLGIQNFVLGTEGKTAGYVDFDPSGKFAYVANSFSGTISAYTFNSGSGSFAPIDADPRMPGIQAFPAGGWSPKFITTTVTIQ